METINRARQPPRFPNGARESSITRVACDHSLRIFFGNAARMNVGISSGRIDSFDPAKCADAGDRGRKKKKILGVRTSVAGNVAIARAALLLRITVDQNGLPNAAPRINAASYVQP